MTNKTERYYVMSEAEFEAALSAQRWFTAHDSDDPNNGISTVELLTRLQQAEAACRVREVSFYDNTFTPSADAPGAKVSGVLWLEEKK